MKNYFFNLRHAFYSALNLLNAGERPKIVVFCYHSVADDYWRYSVDAENIKLQVAHLMHDYHPISAGDLEEYLTGQKDLERPSFLLTFDDGYRNVLELKDHFHALGISPVVFALAHPEVADHSQVGKGLEFLSPIELKELRQAGWTIGCNGATHQDFHALSQQALTFEVVEAKKKLEEDLGFPVKYFAYPKGVYEPQTVEMVEQAGFALGFAMDDGLITQDTRKYQIPRIGVDKSHTFNEFKKIYTRAAINTRGWVKSKVKHSYAR